MRFSGTSLAGRLPLVILVEWEAPTHVAGNAMKREEPVAPPDSLLRCLRETRAFLYATSMRG